MHDQGYTVPTPTMLSNTGFSDLLAKIDFNSKRRCPLTGVLHFLVDFYDTKGEKPLEYCPRSLLKKIISTTPLTPLVGVEFEFFNFKETPASLESKKGVGLTALTNGMFGYSVNRTAIHQSYFDDIFEKSRMFGIPLECFHTETGIFK